MDEAPLESGAAAVLSVMKGDAPASLFVSATTPKKLRLTSAPQEAEQRETEERGGKSGE